jgi:hypothetical protein
MKFLCLVVLLFLPLKLLAQMDERFHTRLTSKLAISGQECAGNEVTVGEDRGTYLEVGCTRKEWMIYVDNINSCIHDACTEIEVLPVTARLKFRAHLPSAQYRYFSIIPTMPVSPEVRWILRRHHLKVDLNGSIQVSKK